jgi:hypothetical protein
MIATSKRGSEWSRLWRPSEPYGTEDHAIPCYQTSPRQGRDVHSTERSLQLQPLRQERNDEVLAHLFKLRYDAAH